MVLAHRQCLPDIVEVAEEEMLTLQSLSSFFFKLAACSMKLSQSISVTPPMTQWGNKGLSGDHVSRPRQPRAIAA